MVNKMTVKNNMNEFYRGRKIFVTGHTGFIGSWLTKSLTLFNSEVCGFALETLSSPNLYEILDIRSASGYSYESSYNKEFFQEKANKYTESAIHIFELVKKHISAPDKLMW